MAAQHMGWSPNKAIGSSARDANSSTACARSDPSQSSRERSRRNERTCSARARRCGPAIFGTGPGGPAEARRHVPLARHQRMNPKHDRKAARAVSRRRAAPKKTATLAGTSQCHRMQQQPRIGELRRQNAKNPMTVTPVARVAIQGTRRTLSSATVSTARPLLTSE